MSARENILQRIRDANRRSGPATIEERERVRETLQRHARGPLPTVAGDLRQRFIERCTALLSTVEEIASIEHMATGVARYLQSQGLPLEGVCWPEFAGLRWADAGLAISSRPALGSDKVGITGSYCAIAETGTLVLLSGENEYATTSLLPETHIAMVRTQRIVRTMEDAWDLLRRERGALPRQVNFVSGPSRTADIEMTLVMGAHGPFRVHIILVGG
jgi:L-lactate dehydrogenase complex protein LldG